MVTDIFRFDPNFITDHTMKLKFNVIDRGIRDLYDEIVYCRVRIQLDLIFLQGILGKNRCFGSLQSKITTVLPLQREGENKNERYYDPFIAMHTYLQSTVKILQSLIS